MADRSYADELEVLDYLSGQAEQYLYLERCCFDGNRDKALRSLSLMFADGAIVITHNGDRIEPWQLDTWRREARFTDIAAKLTGLLIHLP
ncbi:MAG: hypothetical protein ACKVP7_08005 [Hyphomicrobiaceae bacterium]